MTIRVPPEFNERVHDAVGLVCTPEDGTTELLVLGSCFAYGIPTAFLTAAHCLGDRDADALRVLIPGTGVRAVTGVAHHGNADVAILRVAPEDATAVMVPMVARCVAGMDVTVFGYPADLLGQHPERPVPRVLRGYVQRVMTFTSAVTGQSYPAAELSEPSPPGVSGGPVIAEAGVVAIAVESHSSTSVLDSVESKVADGGSHTVVYQRVIEYGIGVHLHEIHDWVATELELPRSFGQRLRTSAGHLVTAAVAVLWKRTPT